jgi:hypothetical protein
MIDPDDLRHKMQEKFRPVDGPTPKIGQAGLKAGCERCFLKEMTAGDKCMCDYNPGRELHPAIRELLKTPPEQRSWLDNYLLERGLEEMEEIKQSMKEYGVWREKMFVLMQQAVEAAKNDGVFYHPCTGCPEWEM